jgi:hypothetical protein
MDRKTCLFDTAFKHYWKNYRIPGLTKSWEGMARKKVRADKDMLFSKIYDRHSLYHIGLIDKRGRLMSRGRNLLLHGQIHGCGSDSFLTSLGRMILIVGRHLEFILWIDREQKSIPCRQKIVNTDYFIALKDILLQRRIAPELVTADEKFTFIRNEFHLWSKLQLIEMRMPNRYHHPGEGLRFNWHRIISIVESEP